MAIRGTKTDKKGTLTGNQSNKQTNMFNALECIILSEVVCWLYCIVNHKMTTFKIKVCLRTMGLFPQTKEKTTANITLRTSIIISNQRNIICCLGNK